MFKLVRNLAAWWPVTVIEPDPVNAGQLVERAFEAEFLILGKSELKAHNDHRSHLVRQLVDEITVLRDASNKESQEVLVRSIEAKIEAHDREMFHRLVTNWRDVTDENDKPIAFSAEALDMALDQERIAAGLKQAYEEAISNDKARLGNSKAPPAAGP
jgi:hypothetical protein